MSALPTYAVLDGGSATELVKAGHDFIDDDPLWSARLLATDSESIKKMHLRFLEVGSDIIETCTYQASIDGFMKYLSVSEDEAKDFIKSGAELAIQVRDEFWEKNSTLLPGRRRPLVAGSIGPYGACLHDGSEYSGSYVEDMSVQVLHDWHRPRIQLLLDAGVDLLAVDTIPAQKEAESIVSLLQEFPDVKAWISFSCKDGEHLNHGEKLQDAVRAIIKCNQVIGVGINCTPPQYASSLVRCIRPLVCGKAIVLYPNSGETWTREKHWEKGEKFKPIKECVAEWLKEGATWIGGCCRIYPQDIFDIRKKMSSVLSS